MKLFLLILILLVSCDPGQNGGNQGGGNGGANSQEDKCLSKNFETIEIETRDAYTDHSNEYFAFLSFKLKQQCPTITFEQIEKEITK